MSYPASKLLMIATRVQRRHGVRISRPEYEARRQKAKRHFERDIKDVLDSLPAIGNTARHERCRHSLGLFLEDYDTEGLHEAGRWREWGKDQIRVIDKVERIVFDGGRCGVAMPRTFAKTAIMSGALLWASFYGHRQFCAIVAAASPMANNLVEDLRTLIETSEPLLEDFRLIVYPIIALEHINQKAQGQTYDGEPTRVTWKGSKLILPTIPGSPASGSILTAVGITGSGMRGLRHRPKEGGVQRPDLLLFDDPQTRKSAYSRPQCERRTAAMNSAVIGMGGGARRLAAMAAMTVIAPEDAAERIIDDPEWQGERTKAMYERPVNQALWDEYYQIRIADLLADGTGSRATDFYKERQQTCGKPLDEKRKCGKCARYKECMDADAVIAWPARYEPDEISAVQFCMNILLANEPEFMAEYQQEPVENLSEQRALEANEVMLKANGLTRGICPRDTHCVVTYEDVHDDVLYWGVMAFTQRGDGHVMAYGTHPDQKRLYYTKKEATLVLQTHYKRTGKKGAILAGLSELATTMATKAFGSVDGQAFASAMNLVDSGHEPDVVEQALRKVDRPETVRASRGRGFTAKSVPFDEYDPKRCRVLGLHWWIPKVSKRRVVYIDTNWWKSYVADAVRTAIGDPGTLTIYGKPHEHRMLADHFCAEYPTRTVGRGRELDEWQEYPARDNHFWDCVVGCHVAAAMTGVRFGGLESKGAKGEKKEIVLSELYKQRKGG